MIDSEYTIPESLRRLGKSPTTFMLTEQVPTFICSTNVGRAAKHNAYSLGHPFSDSVDAIHALVLALYERAEHMVARMNEIASPRPTPVSLSRS